MKQSAGFISVYQKLNPLQKKAVDTIDGPVMVLAGPGTGKTHVLSARIANILLKTDTPPSSILALTFTESAASNMRQRIVSMIGKEGYYVTIQTFHAFCSDVIRNNGDYFPIPRGSIAVSDLDRYKIIETILESENIEALKPINSPTFYVRDIVATIAQLKREGLSPEDFLQIVKREYASPPEKQTKGALLSHTKNKKKNEELGTIYGLYEQALRSKELFDFEDMINLVVQAFRNHPELLTDYQEKLLYFLVDEYQDTNSAQNMVVQQLASYWGEQANIFVVGDPHQSIFRFQGASLENVLGFAKQYPTAEIITLQEGYRCPQIIYDSAAAVIKNNLQSETETPLARELSKKLTGPKDKKGEIIMQELPSQLAETMYVVETIQQLQKEKVKLSEIAILYRNNFDGVIFQEALEKYQIPYQIQGGVNILFDEMIGQFLNLIQLIYQIRSGALPEMIYEVFSYDWTPPDKLLVTKAIAEAGRSRVSLDLYLENFGKKKSAKSDISPIEMASVQSFLETIKEWGRKEYTMTFPAWIELIIQESGYLDFALINDNKIEMIQNLNSLFSKIKEFAERDHMFNLENFLAAISSMRYYNLSIPSVDIITDEQAVQLSTVHKAKGRQWEHVFLVGCVDGKWGNNRSRDMISLPDGLFPNSDISKKETSEDDRRLFYVALTRSANNCYLSYPKTIITQASQKETVPSMFIEEIPEDLVMRNETYELKQASHEYIAKLLSPTEKQERTHGEEAFFRKILENFALSITALNTYLRDPREFVLNNLLRVPRAKKDYFAYGSAIHKALEKKYSYLKSYKKLPPLLDLQKEFETYLAGELIHETNYPRRLSVGKRVLEQYYNHYVDTNIQPIYIEKSFGYGFSKTYLGDVRLTGKIDRIDWIDDKEKTVRVIDYKTGASKSANEIKGLTKSAGLSEREQSLPESIRGPYMRQLLFYKLLTQLDSTFKENVVEGILDFVEPDKYTEKFTRHSFVLEDSAVEDLKKLINEVMKEIKNLDFLNYF